MLFVIVGAFIVLDMITGLLKAMLKKEYTSTIMREGLFHKCGSIICIAFGVLVDYAQTLIDLGVTVPVTNALCAYIIIMEIGSIIENVGIINPEIVPENLRSLFDKLKAREPDADK